MKISCYRNWCHAAWTNEIWKKKKWSFYEKKNKNKNKSITRRSSSWYEENWSWCGLLNLHLLARNSRWILPPLQQVSVQHYYETWIAGWHLRRNLCLTLWKEGVILWLTLEDGDGFLFIVWGSTDLLLSARHNSIGNWKWPHVEIWCHLWTLIWSLQLAMNAWGYEDRIQTKRHVISVGLCTSLRPVLFDTAYCVTVSHKCCTMVPFLRYLWHHVWWADEQTLRRKCNGPMRLEKNATYENRLLQAPDGGGAWRDIRVSSD